MPYENTRVARGARIEPASYEYLEGLKADSATIAKLRSYEAHKPFSLLSHLKSHMHDTVEFLGPETYQTVADFLYGQLTPTARELIDRIEIVPPLSLQYIDNLDVDSETIKKLRTYNLKYPQNRENAPSLFSCLSADPQHSVQLLGALEYKRVLKGLAHQIITEELAVLEDAGPDSRPGFGRKEINYRYLASLVRASQRTERPTQLEYQSSADLVAYLEENQEYAAEFLGETTYELVDAGLRNGLSIEEQEKLRNIRAERRSASSAGAPILLDEPRAKKSGLLEELNS